MNIVIRELEVFIICSVLGSFCLAASIFAQPMGGLTIGFAVVAGMMYGACISRIDVTRTKSGN